MPLTFDVATSDWLPVNHKKTAISVAKLALLVLHVGMVLSTNLNGKRVEEGNRKPAGSVESILSWSKKGQS